MSKLNKAAQLVIESAKSVCCDMRGMTALQLTDFRDSVELLAAEASLEQEIDNDAVAALHKVHGLLKEWDNTKPHYPENVQNEIIRDAYKTLRNVIASESLFASNPAYLPKRVDDDKSEVRVHVDALEFWSDLVGSNTPFSNENLELRYGVPEIKKLNIEIHFTAGTEAPESWDIKPIALLEWDAHKGAIDIMLDVATVIADTHKTAEVVEATAAPQKVREGVHVSHCCVKHGCKYGEPSCPVVNKTALQRYPCEDCVDGDSFLDDIKLEDDSEKLETLNNLHMYHDVENDDVGRMAWTAGNNECAFLLMKGEELKVVPLNPNDPDFARAYVSGFNACLQGTQEKDKRED